MTRWKQTLKVCLCISVLGCWPSQSWPLGFTDKYDTSFERSTKQWLPDIPSWKLLKAQCYQESRLIPTAVSPAGAKGLCQFLSGTWGDVGRALSWGAAISAFDPNMSIEAAAYYMARLRYQWRRNRTTLERHDMALASYNAGIGHILAAQRHCRDERLWAAVSPCLPQVTGDRNAAETAGYVRNIAKWWRMMEIE